MNKGKVTMLDAVKKKCVVELESPDWRELPLGCCVAVVNLSEALRVSGLEREVEELRKKVAEMEDASKRCKGCGEKIPEGEQHFCPGKRRSYDEIVYKGEGRESLTDKQSRK